MDIKIQDFKEVILKAVKNGEDAYLRAQNSIQYSFVDNIDCKQLPKPVWQKGVELPKGIDQYFKTLKDRTRPYLYFFEILNSNSSTILDTYKAFKSENEKIKEGKRNSPTLKKRPPKDTNILYVGKVKKDMYGRLYVHLGYYHNGFTAGLQLVCWAKDIDLKLKLHLFSFSPNMQEFVTPLELPLARALNPLIGKH
jgi:hypothetical protein